MQEKIVIDKTEEHTKGRKQFPPGSVITFYDKYSKNSIVEKTGCNQTGIYLSSDKIIFCRKNKLIIERIDDLEKFSSKAYVQKITDEKLGLKISRFISHNIANHHLFKSTLQALELDNFKLFDNPDVMPKFSKYESYDLYEKRYDSLIQKMVEGDLINTFNENSLISKTIARLDNGSWSHSAIYIGNGEVLEAISRGVVKNRLEAYKKREVHIGIFRPAHARKKQIDDMVKWSLMHLGAKYNYIGAIKLGIKILLGLPTDVPTPNGLIYRGHFYLVDYL